jgi:hypothetical protein
MEPCPSLCMHNGECRRGWPYHTLLSAYRYAEDHSERFYFHLRVGEAGAIISPFQSALPPLAEGSGICARACRNVCATAAAPGATVNTRRRTGRARARARRHAHEHELALHPDTHGHANYLLLLASSLVLPHFPSFLLHFLARSAKHCS